MNVFPKAGFIPEELIVEILSFLDPETIFRVAAVCRSWRRLASDGVLWKRICFNLYGPLLRNRSLFLDARLSDQWKANFLVLRGSRHLQDLVGDNHSLVLTNSGKLRMLFRGDSPPLPEGEVPGVRWVWVSSGDNHFAAIDHKGRLFTSCWGEFGQLGHGNKKNCSALKIVKALSRERMHAVSCGSLHTVCCTTTGKVFSFGAGVYGQLGQGAPKDSLLPTRVWGKQDLCPLWSTSNIVSVSAGTNFSLALSDRGIAFSWGHGGLGKTGLGSTRTTTSPRKIVGLEGIKITMISAGAEHSALIDSVGRLYTFGFGWHGELGHDEFDHCNSPRVVKAFEGNRMTCVCAGSGYTLAIDEEGTVYGFGVNEFGRGGWKMNVESAFPLNGENVNNEGAGVERVEYTRRLTKIVSKKVELERPLERRRFMFEENPFTRSAVPVRIDRVPERMVTVSAGRFNSVGISASGNTYCWGMGEFGLDIYQYVNQSFVPHPVKIDLGEDMAAPMASV